MTKKYFSVFLESVGIQILFSVASMVFFVNVFPVAYSLFTAWLLIWALHSIFWRLGNKEGKMIVIHNNNLKEGEAPKKKPIFKGALIALPHFILNIIILLLTNFLNKDILLIIEALITFPFANLLAPATDALGGKYLSTRILACLAMYLPCVTAYITGMLNFSFIDRYYRKIIYKTPSKKDN